MNELAPRRGRPPTDNAPKHLRTFTCTDDEWKSFQLAVHTADPEVSASHAIRELMRWYTGGCGGPLRLVIPIVYPPLDRPGVVR
jgi:hypothetical protein